MSEKFINQSALCSFLSSTKFSLNFRFLQFNCRNVKKNGFSTNIKQLNFMLKWPYVDIFGFLKKLHCSGHYLSAIAAPEKHNAMRFCGAPIHNTAIAAAIDFQIFLQSSHWELIHQRKHDFSDFFFYCNFPTCSLHYDIILE